MKNISTRTGLDYPAFAAVALIAASAMWITGCGGGERDTGQHHQVRTALAEFVDGPEGALIFHGPDPAQQVRVTGGGGQPLVVHLPTEAMTEDYHHDYAVEVLTEAPAQQVATGGAAGYHAQFGTDDEQVELAADLVRNAFRTFYGVPRDAQLTIERE